MFCIVSVAAPFHHRQWGEAREGTNKAVKNLVLLVEGDTSSACAFDSYYLSQNSPGNTLMWKELGQAEPFGEIR